MTDIKLNFGLLTQVEEVLIFRLSQCFQLDDSAVLTDIVGGCHYVTLTHVDVKLALMGIEVVISTWLSKMFESCELQFLHYMSVS